MFILNHNFLSHLDISIPIQFVFIFVYALNEPMDIDTHTLEYTHTY